MEEIKETKQEEKEKEEIEELNLGFGIGNCLHYLETHKELYDDGIEDDSDDDISIDRYDDFGKKIKPFEQYKLMCHRFHGKKPKKLKKLSSKEYQKQLKQKKQKQFLQLQPSKALSLLQFRLQCSNHSEKHQNEISNESKK